MAKSISDLLNSSAPVEEIAGALLERVAGAGESPMGFQPTGVVKVCRFDPAKTRLDMEALQWLIAKWDGCIDRRSRHKVRGL